jgi:putative drug exporter of the RND superfamily
VLTPIDVLTRAGHADALAQQAQQIPGIYTAFTGPTAAGTTLIEVLPAAEPSSAAGSHTLALVRHALNRQPGVLGVGGQGATNADFINAVYGTFPLMLSLIAVVTLILLTRAFRSVLLAAKAVIFNRGCPARR